MRSLSHQQLFFCFGIYSFFYILLFFFSLFSFLKEFKMKNNVFEKHNIDHLSASTINLFISQPAMCLLKLTGYKSQVGASAWRGSAVDKTLTTALQFDDMTLEVAKSNAEKSFNALRYDEDIETDKIKKELSVTGKCIERAFEDLLPDYRGKEMNGSQGKIEVMLED